VRALRVIDGEARDLVSHEHALGIVPSVAIAESLVVFSHGGDVYGITGTGETFGTPFPISTGEEWDSGARVYLAGANRYLVTYVREAGGPDIRLVRRFVTLGLP
jgi:hypothetical protein